MRQRLRLLLGIAAVAVGCNKGPALQTYPVTGTVTYNGKPLDGAAVAFVNKNPDERSAAATTDQEGRFSLTTFVGAGQILRGAPAGEYGVTITKMTAESAASNGPDMEHMSAQERQAMMTKMMSDQIPTRGADGKPVDKKPKSAIPEKYNSVKTSGFSATVASGDNPPVEYKLSD